jgi:hypothetical protein
MPLSFNQVRAFLMVSQFLIPYKVTNAAISLYFLILQHNKKAAFKKTDCGFNRLQDAEYDAICNGEWLFLLKSVSG